MATYPYEVARAACIARRARSARRNAIRSIGTKLEPEILERFTELLRIDTSNPPGNETRAAKAIQAMLEREGIATRMFALDPARANLVARIKGQRRQAADPADGPHRRGRRAAREVERRSVRGGAEERRRSTAAARATTSRTWSRA